MDITFILTVVGILFTLILGIWSIILVIKNRYPGGITFYETGIIGLYDTIIKNFPELSVQYNNVNVNKNYFLLKGSIVNSGNKDITESMIEEKLSLEYTEVIKWLNARIISTDSRVKADVQIQDDKLVFNFGLFRCKEYFRFEVLFEIPVEIVDSKEFQPDMLKEYFTERLKFSHRIADTKKVNIINVVLDRYLKPKTMAMITVLGIVYAIYFMLVYLIFPGFNSVAYSVNVGDKSQNVFIEATRDGNVVVRGVDNDYYEEITIKEFNARNYKNGKIVHSKVIQNRSLFLVFAIISFISFSIIIFIINRKQTRKLLRQIGYS